MSFRSSLIVIAMIAIGVITGAVLRCHYPGLRPRNVILICVDTVRYDTWYLAGQMGWSDPMTAWEDRGVRFEGMQAAAPWTVPSVASVFTSLYPLHHGAGAFSSRVADLNKMPPSVLPDSIDTLAEDLHAHGWKTAAILPPSWVNPDTGLLQGVSDIRNVAASGVTDSAIAWVRDHPAADPYFLYVHYMEAHGDQPPETKLSMANSFSERDRRRLISLASPGLCSEAADCIEYLSYVRAVQDLRANIARLLDSLERQKRLDDTVVILFSDHGEEWKDHAAEEKALGTDPYESWGFGHGRSLYHELIHVPVLVWHPHFRARAVAAPLSLVDLAPTIREWLDIENIEPKKSSPAKLSKQDGISFADIGDIGGETTSERPLYFSGIGFGPEQYGMMWNGWKQVRIDCPDTALTFKLSDDPLEKQPSGPTRLDRRLATLLDSYRASAGTVAVQEAKLSQAQIESLRGIGYLQGGNTHPSTGDSACLNVGSGFDSIGAFDPESGTFFLRMTNTSGVADVTIHSETKGLPVVGDWNGKGGSKAGIFVPSQSEFLLYPRNLASKPDREVILKVPPPRNGDLPVAGDWDGDGIDTVGIYRPATSTFYLRNSNASGSPDLTIKFGERGDTPVVGDWTRSGRTQVGVFRPALATFFLRGTNGGNETTTAVTFGTSEDVPVTGDWDGDGTTTIGVYRPSLAMFFLRNRNDVGNADITFTFGTSKFLPLAGDWPR